MESHNVHLSAPKNLMRRKVGGKRAYNILGSRHQKYQPFHLSYTRKIDQFTQVPGIGV